MIGRSALYLVQRETRRKSTGAEAGTQLAPAVKVSSATRASQECDPIAQQLRACGRTFPVPVPAAGWVGARVGPKCASRLRSSGAGRSGAGRQTIWPSPNPCGWRCCCWLAGLLAWLGLSWLAIACCGVRTNDRHRTLHRLPFHPAPCCSSGLDHHVRSARSLSVICKLVQTASIDIDIVVTIISIIILSIRTARVRASPRPPSAPRRVAVATNPPGWSHSSILPWP